MTPTARPSTYWPVWVIAAGALLLSLVALIVVFEALRPGASATSLWITGLNLITGLAGLAGAMGYGMKARWGVYSFGLSVLGHCIAHGLLIVSAFTLSRASLFTFVGPLVIPVVALAILFGMIWTNSVYKWS